MFWVFWFAFPYNISFSTTLDDHQIVYDVCYFYLCFALIEEEGDDRAERDEGLWISIPNSNEPGWVLVGGVRVSKRSLI